MSNGFKYINGSFQINNQGHIDIVSGSDKVRKDVYKMLVTDKVGNYGTEINKLIGQKLKPLSMDLNLKTYLKECMVNFVGIQRTNRYLENNETIVDANMDVWHDPEDVTTVNYKLELILASGDIIDDLPIQSIKAGYTQ